jgi:hypothetical protein
VRIVEGYESGVYLYFKSSWCKHDLDFAGNRLFNIQICFFLNVQPTGVLLFCFVLFLHGERPVALSLTLLVQ